MNDVLSEAIRKEINGDFEGASKVYESAVCNKTTFWPAFVNLMVLYWQITDYGFWTDNNISKVFLKKAQERLEDLLEQAKGSTESIARFWANYIEWVDVGQEFPSKLAKDEFIDGYQNDSLVYHLATEKNQDLMEKTRKALKELRLDNSTRGRYLVSVMESHLSKSIEEKKLGSI